MTYLTKIYFSLIICLLTLSCNVQPNNSQTGNKTENSDFEINTDSVEFNFVQELNHVSFGGDIYFKNISSYNISNLLFSDRYFEIDFSDNTSLKYDMMMFGPWKLKPNSSNKCKIGIDPFNNSKPYLLVDDFNRTPQKAFLKFSFTAVNIDKEIPESFTIDVLPKWIEFQKQRGLR